jgi:ketosteroid isomerase-like protein
VPKGEDAQKMARSTEQVFEDHKNAILNSDFPKLMADYADSAVLMTMDGTFVGKDAIQGFFQNLFASQPNARVDFRRTVAEGDTLLLEWSAESDVATMPQGVDTFVIQDDKIRRQTMWFTVVPKGT